MKLISTSVAIAILCYSCSSTNLMSLSVTEPAPVSLSPNAHSAAVIDRSRAADENRVIDAIHKTLSLETKNLQAEGARASVAGLKDELARSNRFTAVQYLDKLDLRSYGAGIFPVCLPWDSVEKICRENHSDVLFSLELFDAQTKVGANTANNVIPIGNVPILNQQVNVNTLVRTGWRIYDPASRTILDEFVLSRDFVFQTRGLDVVAAGAALMGHKEEVKRAGGNAGQAYAQRILPYSIRVSRFYYVRGNDDFKMARRMAQTGNWDGAGQLWQQETKNPSRKVAGRACYNMGIISEINGDVDGAIMWAQKAYELYGDRLALSYVNVLRQRQNENALLKTQTETTSN
jgi:hypothetical protein